MQQLIILRGYPGSGKTTLGKLLQQNKIGTFIDHNSILNFIAAIVGNDNGIYNEIHDIELAMARKLLNEGKTAIIARGFSSAKSLKPYMDLGIKIPVQIHIFRLDADISILNSRVMATERLSDFNPTVTPEALHTWIANNPIEQVTHEVIIDAAQEPSQIMEQIRHLLLD